ncbi:MAG: tetratricopeptide repeat protein [Bacteroidales bacterium]|jgi:tetratricopeptide (TPR) repeat protein|nr:tetratricopeptide repeat protein [Bacteroidales bacterium]
MRKWLLVISLLLVSAVMQAQKSRAIIPQRDTPGEYAEKISNFFSQHRWAKGKELLDQAMEYYPEEAGLHYLAGRYWWNGKDYDKARYHLVKACQINYHYMDAKTLLVNLEEMTGNYSSAICYVNELLEVNPYWKGLWLRKVDLYKKMGNFEEANSLLRRLSQIYPNDASINSDYFDVLEATYQQARLSGDTSAAEDALREIVVMTPNDVDYQLAYANILIRKGKMNDALENLTAAINANPGNVPLVKKATDILMETGRNAAALTMVRSQLALHRNSGLEELYQMLLAESARMESEADVYQLFTRTYDAEKSLEALQYLLNQSIKRGYFDDAIHYISEMRQKQGDSPRWYMMEYDVYARMGRHESASRSINQGFQLYPDDYDINLAISRQRLSDAADYINEEAYGLAIPLLEFVRKSSVDPDLRVLAVRRLAVCYRETNQPEKAVAMLRERLKTDPESQVTLDYASLLVKQGKADAALQALYASYMDATDSLSIRLLAGAYKETAYTYLRDRLQAGSFTGLNEICETILQMDPTDYWGLRYSLRTSESPLPYALRGIDAYPGDLTFPIKAASIYAEQGREEEALAILSPYLLEFPADEDLQKSFAGISDSFATKLLKSKDIDRAEKILEKALQVRPNDPAVRYSRGLVYEKRKDWDSAYVYQRNYQPSLLEEREYKSRMNSLRARTLHNSVDAGVDILRFTDKYNVMGIATVGYSHNWKNDEFQSRINFTSRDPEYDDEKKMYLSAGGRGLQFQTAWTHHFAQLFSLQVGGSFGTAFFPIASGDLTGTFHLKHDWDLDVGAQFRYLQDKAQMYAGNIGATHTWENMYAGAKFTCGTIYHIVFFNGSLRYRFFPFDGGRSYVEAQAGAGTAPEILFLNYYQTSSVFNHLNSFVAVTAQWAITHNLAIQLSGTWNTLYDQRATVSYRNLLMGHVSLSISF